MKTFILLLSLVVSTEMAFAQGNFIYHGETKLFRTHGARKIQVTCAGGMNSYGSEVGFFWHKDCQGLGGTVELTGSLLDDHYVCKNLPDLTRAGRKMSISIEGKCVNLGPDPSKYDNWETEQACVVASQKIKSGF